MHLPLGCQAINTSKWKLEWAVSDSQRTEFWLAGVVLDLRFALSLLSGIFLPFSFSVCPSLSCVSRLGTQ